MYRGVGVGGERNGWTRTDRGVCVWGGGGGGRGGGAENKQEHNMKIRNYGKIPLALLLHFVPSPLLLIVSVPSPDVAVLARDVWVRVLLDQCEEHAARAALPRPVLQAGKENQSPLTRPASTNQIKSSKNSSCLVQNCPYVGEYMPNLSKKTKQTKLTTTTTALKKKRKKEKKKKRKRSYTN